MKKILIALIAFTSLNADPGVLLAKVVSSDTNGYFMFSDGSFWKLSSFVVRWRTPFEWASGNELYVPDDYQCEVSDWALGDEYEVYYKMGSLRVDETHASNEEELKKHPFLMTNLRSGKTFFASQVQPGDFVLSVYDVGFNKGYSDGYYQGYSLGHSAGVEAGRLQAQGALYP